MRKEEFISLSVGVGLLVEVLLHVFTYDPVPQVQIANQRFEESCIKSDEKQEVALVQQDILAIDEAELDLLSRLIFAEAGSGTCSSEMRYLVGAVALNRVKSQEYPDSLQEVIYQDKPCLQYACVKDGHINNQPTEECVQIAYELLTNGSYVPETVVFQSEFKQGSGVYKRIGNMYFCYR